MADATCNERWLPIPGWEGYYDVSDQGRVRSVDRVILRSTGVEARLRGKPKTPRDTGHQLVAGLHRDNFGINLFVHVAVLTAFVGPCPDGMEGCHWDDDYRNNRLGNLRWATHADNMADKLRNGNNDRAVKTVCRRGHPLFPPNLSPGMLKHGSRSCLACTRALGMARYRIKCGEIRADELDFQALSDLYYEEVVATGGQLRIRPIRDRHDIPLPRLATP